VKILNKNGLPYFIRVLFAPGVVILPIELDLSDFFEFRFSLHKERTPLFRSFFSLGRYVNEFIQIVSFFEQSSFKLRCETAIGIVLCYSHRACCLLYYLCEISSNNGIHIYLSGCNCGFGFEQKDWRIDGFGEKKAWIGGFAYPYSPPPHTYGFFNFNSSGCLKKKRISTITQRI